MVNFYAFPKQHWKHLRKTNVIESPFATVRLRTGAAKRYKKVENATAVIWKVLRIAERSFRRLNAPELLPDVLVKGGDYQLDQIHGREEVEAAGGKVISLPFVDGASTSALIERMKKK